MSETLVSYAEFALQVVVWSALTILFYLGAKQLYRRWHHWWLMPLLVAPVLLIALAMLTHESYANYINGAGWLLTLLGPATVAFAVPIYEQREEIRRYWPVLLVGMIVGSLTSIFVSWELAGLLGLDGDLKLSLLPRSISTPFAMEVSSEIGGRPNLTAIFVVVTGVIGAAVGEGLSKVLHVQSPIAKAALFGVGAHGAGTARAHEIGRTEGSLAGLLMVLVGLLNVLIAMGYAVLFA